MFLDATIVRMLLVPATMELLGDRNWWLPRGSTASPADIHVEGGHDVDYHLPFDDEPDLAATSPTSSRRPQRPSRFRPWLICRRPSRTLWARRDELGPDDSADHRAARAAVEEAIDLLDRGEARVAELGADGEVVVHQWLKQAILLLFRLNEIGTIELGPFEYADKLPLKSGYEAAGVRVVPGASARRGSFLDRGVILMPSYVNIGARVGAGSMVDTWATVGSCAQIGANVHLSGGVGIGGVLEPPQAAPVIIGDDAMIGSRSMIVEGARVGRGRRSSAPASSSPPRSPSSTPRPARSSPGASCRRGAWPCRPPGPGRSPVASSGSPACSSSSASPRASATTRPPSTTLLRDHGLTA